ncbi:CLUMA_CG019837, isoform A [Clunio marinus]|uniref:CLUMA_CG019837, isoform A n=1 Tax=Clunio marinus TaxID=568069 RepID=A0A1J1J3B7_9DIPT|nr:CLUMA_CG019837, isoform A [Clunio marinus]
MVKAGSVVDLHLAPISERELAKKKEATMNTTTLLNATSMKKKRDNHVQRQDLSQKKQLVEEAFNSFLGKKCFSLKKMKSHGIFLINLPYNTKQKKHLALSTLLCVFR